VLNGDNNQKITIDAGSPLSLAAVRSGMRLSFQCKQGTCSSCETILDGTRVRTCITKVPDKKSITLKKATPL
jgi:ferredoxin